MMPRPLAYGVAGAAVLVALVGACRFVGKSSQDIEPDAAPGEKAVLLYAGAKIPVKVYYSRSGSEINLVLKVDDVVLESEHYASTSDEFALTWAAGEKFSPGLPLLKFPFKLGDHYHWAGTLNLGGLEHKGEKVEADPKTTHSEFDRSATAEVTSSESSVTVDGQKVPAILADAKVSIDGGGDKPALRELKFWIVAKRGVMMRDFSECSRREPQ